MGISFCIGKVELAIRADVRSQTEAPVGDGTPLIAGEVHGLVDGVNHHEVIASAVHFGESEIHAFTFFVNQRQYRTRSLRLLAVS